MPGHGYRQIVMIEAGGFYPGIYGTLRQSVASWHSRASTPSVSHWNSWTSSESQQSSSDACRMFSTLRRPLRRSLRQTPLCQSYTSSRALTAGRLRLYFTAFQGNLDFCSYTDKKLGNVIEWLSRGLQNASEHAWVWFQTACVDGQRSAQGT